MFDSFMQKFVKWLDPKLERFRSHQDSPKPQKYTPKTLEEFIEVLQRTPHNILSNRDRSRIAAIMSFDDRTIDKLMIPKSRMVFVNSSVRTRCETMLSTVGSNWDKLNGEFNQILCVLNFVRSSIL